MDKARVSAGPGIRGLGGCPRNRCRSSVLRDRRVRRQLADPLVDPDVDGVACLLADCLPQRRLDRESM